MATKMYNEHIDTILYNAKKYYTIDIYARLVNISSQFKDSNTGNDLFLIQTAYINLDENQSIDILRKKQLKDLVNILHKFIDVEKSTLLAGINELISLHILSFNDDENSWELCNMSNMYKSNANSTDLNSGYTKLKDILLSKDFNNMKPYQKKLWLFSCQIMDTKAAKNMYKVADCFMNLCNNTSKWKKILNTKSKYYARTRIKDFIAVNKDILENLTEKTRKIKYYSPKEESFCFAFNFKEGVNKNTDEDFLTEVSLAKEITLIKETASTYNLSITKNKIYQLARAIRNVKYYKIKRYVVNAIINKLIDNTKQIKSIPAYATHIIKVRVDELERFLKEKLKSDPQYDVLQYIG